MISDSYVFSKSSLYIWNFSVQVLLKTSLKDIERYLTSIQNECNCVVIWTFFGLIFLWDWNEKWPFPVLWPLLSFPSFPSHCSTLTASSFRIWNSSAGIPSPPLALLIVMPHKAQMTSHSRMSHSRWVIIPSWSSGSLSPFLYSFVYSCYLFLSLLLLLSPCHFCSLLCTSLPEIFPQYHQFFFLTRSLVFPSLLFSCFLHCSLKKAFLSLVFSGTHLGIPFPFSFAFHFSSFLCYF